MDAGEIQDPMTMRNRPLPLDLRDIRTVRRLQMHMNFGREGGAAVYSIHEPDGNPLPFSWQYRSGARKDPSLNFQGFILIGREDKHYSGSELIAAWPEYVVELNAKGEKQWTP